MNPLTNRRPRRVLAIDPGYDRCGVAVLEGDPSHPVVLMSECITPPPGSLATRLGFLHQAIARQVASFSPEALALETLFFSTNKKTAMAVAHARGMILTIAGVSGLPVIECSPQQVKLSVTGHGASPKTALAQMIPHLVSLPPKKRLDDEFDAIAVGIAALSVGFSP